MVMTPVWLKGLERHLNSKVFCHYQCVVLKKCNYDFCSNLHNNISNKSNMLNKLIWCEYTKSLIEYKNLFYSELWTGYQETTAKLTQEWTEIVHQKGQSLYVAQKEDTIPKENWQIEEKVRLKKFS
jgi:hypothetical protein